MNGDGDDNCVAILIVIIPMMAMVVIRAVRRQKRRLVQAPFKAPIHSKCCIGGFRETGLVLVVVLRCD